jgi:threonine dehydrogenase-like Zn-dependent dehydrogenase
MRASVVAGPRVAVSLSLPVPQPGPGEVRIRVEGCGVCGSNVPPWEGRPWFEYPLQPGSPGHEGWGVVDAVAEGVAVPCVGERVAALSYRAFAEYDVAAAEQVVVIPPALEGKPFPAEPLGCAMNVLRRTALAAGQTVVIVGIGFLGALLTRLASVAGARVVAVSRRPFALEVAREMGAADVVPFDAEVDAALAAKTDGGAERVIEAVGHQDALDVASRATRERGRLVVAGYHQDGQRRVDMQLWNWRGINAHERDPALYVRGMREAIAATLDGTLDISPLITHTLPLDRLDAALRLTVERPAGFLKAVVAP